MVSVDFVKEWSTRYPVKYDQDYYDPYIAKARIGDTDALRKVTEWKTIGPGLRPMRFSSNKEKPFKKLIDNKKRYLVASGQENLRNDFSRNAPVWAIFWHHVFFQTPIFDVYTHTWLIIGTRLASS